MTDGQTQMQKEKEKEKGKLRLTFTFRQRQSRDNIDTHSWRKGKASTIVLERKGRLRACF